MKNALYLLLMGYLFVACSEDDTVTKIVDLKVSEDGFIINSSPRMVLQSMTGGQGEELRVGWDEEGKAMRAFLSFDLGQVLPADDEVLTINSAILKVYEANTNLHPFDGEGQDRTVEVELMDYGALDQNDFAANAYATCGTIADLGYNVLAEYSLDVTAQVKDYYQENLSNNETVQFRLHFTGDNIVDASGSNELVSSMWNIFAQEEGNDYVSILTMNYTIAKK